MLTLTAQKSYVVVNVSIIAAHCSNIAPGRHYMTDTQTLCGHTYLHCGLKTFVFNVRINKESTWQHAR